jgi:hypothetical protein
MKKNPYKVGDKIEYFGTDTMSLKGKRGVVTGVLSNSHVTANFVGYGGGNAHIDNIRLIFDEKDFMVDL